MIKEKGENGERVLSCFFSYGHYSYGRGPSSGLTNFQMPQLLTAQEISVDELLEHINNPFITREYVEILSDYKKGLHRK